MLIGRFTERPYQDPSSGYFGATGRSIQDLSISNGEYDPQLGSELYNRYLDEQVAAEEAGFDAIMLNEHHSTPFCMGGTVNTEAAILARITDKVKIVINGNVLPIWDDPLWLAEELATIDMISKGRLVTGWVRGTGRESVAHNAPPPFNWERFQEAHDFIIKAWTTPGPFRWEGEHYDFRYVNPWMRPYQNPHPQIMIPGVVSKNTVKWSAEHRYPYLMLATRLEPTKASFDYYREVAHQSGYEAGPQHLGYLFKVHVDETEELAYETGKKFLDGPGNIFLEGSRGTASPVLQNLPGLTDRKNLLPTGEVGFVAASRGRNAADVARDNNANKPDPRNVRGAQTQATLADYDTQLENYTIISGTPKTVLPKIRHVLETLRPGTIFFWDGDGAMTHDDSMRSLRLMGSDVIPAVKEMAKELDLPGSFEIDTKTNEPYNPAPAIAEVAGGGA
ncbi:MAG: LLM class flavin-dependent oxidoreductase [Chloroflexi bacterium]|nr:LLM class flavin-dependent oxidoreductase [Chloroflexota bacterium]|tara:strand:+ start:4396 stop:5742 length:1347 start_codon:yes stop_codon:yes gene_type:complete